MACGTCHTDDCICNTYRVGYITAAVTGATGEQGPAGDSQEVVVFDSDYQVDGFTPITFDALTVPQSLSFYSWTSAGELESTGDVLELTAYFSIGSIGNGIHIEVDGQYITYDGNQQGEVFNNGADYCILTLTLHRISATTFFTEYHVEYYENNTALPINKYFHYPETSNPTPLTVADVETFTVNWFCDALVSPVDITMERLRVEKYNKPV